MTTGTTRRPRRHVSVTLLPEEWDALCEQARADVRDPYQHARYLLTRALGCVSSADDEPDASGDEVLSVPA